MKYLRRITLIALLCPLLTAHAVSIEQVAQAREAKLEASLQDLRQLRETIHNERLPLAQKLQSLDAQVSELESEVAKVQGLKDNQDLELSSLREKVQHRQRSIDYITRTLIPSHIADIDASLSMGQRQHFGEQIRSYNLEIENINTAELEKLQQSLALIKASLPELNEALGGHAYAGKALTPSSTFETGTFLEVGPLLYFASDQTPTAGLVSSSNHNNAEVLPLDKRQSSDIQAVANNKVGTLAMDYTHGAALAIEATKDSIQEHLVKGGIWVYPILAFAFIATIVSIYKGIQIMTIRHPQPLVIHDIIAKLRANKQDEALAIAEAQPQPARQILSAAIEHSNESVEMVEEVMYEAMLTIHPKLERFLNLIAVTAAAAPLLGLLGTVTGIIKTFRLMTVFGAGDPAPLISGISEALITTELGLILAIPALVMHALLSRKVTGTMAHLEKMSVTFVNGLSRQKIK
ncbi:MULTISPECIES: MotA/TolQ/ExbB proton channel family protein [unclassified Lentimonas]|uniref:MotA/TolQ/ExbB proton channel family protein n=1 Tax=unclassified Lentimonas TaxID=2630993 RepID=UPI00132BEC1E|nr:MULTISPECIES: MotA/TolQ/ExbB proton channel family protein [unclassified Lentimonas]CAA6695442.1 Unannotated [Lentimonas sp. CC10]CAA6696615.1 Unannotated [Lentimonas sp. CC19]CAA7071305.1 Unannotated [Lentimonas sp. CC11]